MLDDTATDTVRQDSVVREDYWVEVAGQDSDRTGETDRVHVEVAYPSSAQGELPVVVEASPYYGGFNQVRPNPVEVELWSPGDEADSLFVGEEPEPIEIDPDELTEFTGHENEDSIGPSPYEAEFLQQGYAWAYAASVGTEESTGCLDTGGERELNGVEAVIDWFNGRATAYESKSGSTTAEADFTNGRTAMIGASYNGTLPNAMASRGVGGLETIVPVIAISSWYDYYRANGHTKAPGTSDALSFGGDANWLQKAVLDDIEACSHVTEELVEGQDRTTGDYNEFWRERDYVTNADSVEASVLLTSGLYDYNVWLRNASRWLDALKDNDVPYKVWFHQGAHQDPIGDGFTDEARAEWLDLLTDWFAYWLKDEETGVMDGPTAHVQRKSTAGPLETYEDWPAPDATQVAVEPGAGGETRGALSVRGGEDATESFLDRSQVEAGSPVDWDVSVFNFVAQEESPHRLLYRTAALDEQVRLSGTPEASLRLAVEDDDAAIVSVALVDYAPDGSQQVLNFGRMNPHNRDSLTESKPIEPGEFYDLSFPLQPVDHVFEPGHRVGLAVYSSDIHFTKRPPTNPELSLDVGGSSVALPVVGGRRRLESALDVPYLDDQWEAEPATPRPLGSPAADATQVYTTTGTGAVTATARDSGEVAWAEQLPAQGVDAPAPLATGESVYAAGGESLAAFDTDGSQRWTYDAGEDGTITATPAAEDGAVFVATRQGVVHAVDTDTGQRAWRTALDSPVYGSVVAGDGVVCVATLDGRVVALEKATGEQRWSFETGASLGDSSPAVRDGTVYVAGDDVHAVDAATGDEQFRVGSYGGTAGSTPTVTSDLLYVGGIDDRLYAVDTAAAAVAWTYEATDSVAARPVLLGGAVFVPSKDGQVHVVDAQTGTGLSTKSLPSETAASPTRTAGDLYVTARDGTLAAFSALTEGSQ